jgi:hypothetical protein
MTSAKRACKYSTDSWKSGQLHAIRNGASVLANRATSESTQIYRETSNIQQLQLHTWA